MSNSKDQIARLRAPNKDIDDTKLQELIEAEWVKLKRDPKKAAELGIDPTLLSSPSSPFRAEPAGGQFGIAEAIVVYVLKTAGSAAIGAAVRTLWKVIWARISKNQGDKLEQDDSG